MSQVDDAALRARVRQLAEQLAEVQQMVRLISRGVTAEAEEIKEVVLGLAERVDALQTAPPEEKKEDPEPVAWVDHATARDWEELASWVDWLVTTYDLTPTLTVLPCWPAHLGVAEELAALRAAWRAAAISGGAPKPNDALIYWHDT